MEKRRVVITGLGCVTPLGHTVAETWQAVKDGVCGIGPITQYDAENQKVKLCAEVKDFDPTAWMDRREAKHMARFAQLAVASAQQAVADGGLDMEREDPLRCGVIVSSGIGGLSITVEELVKGQTKGFDRISPFYIPMTICNMAAGLIAIRHGFQGMCTCPVTACAGGTNAVGDAFRQIRDGYADVMLCGGAESVVTPLAVGGFTSMKALHTGDDPARASIPFDRERSGFVLGEGAGILLLEEYGRARARGARIYAEVAGYGATCDAYHMTSPDPTAAEGARAIADAWHETGILTDRVYFNAHGTGTPMNDRVETLAIKRALGEELAHKLLISSTKSMTGHMLGAAGGAEAVACVLALRDGIAPPTIGLQEPDPDCDLNYVPLEAQKQEFDVALSSSLGFGGHNACLAFRKIGGGRDA